MNKKLLLSLFLVVNLSKTYSQITDSIIKIVFTEKIANRLDTALFKPKYTNYKSYLEKKASLYINKKSSFYVSNEYNNYRELYSKVLNNKSLDPEANQNKTVVESSLEKMAVLKDFNKIYKRKLGSNNIQINDFCQTSAGYKKYYFEDSSEKVAWKLSEETKIVAGFLCQKATGWFRGRTWEVWFTSKIPISAGPWKLYGLPGLILEARDSSNLYLYEADIVISPSAPPTDNSLTINKNVLVTNYKEWLQLAKKSFTEIQDQAKKLVEIFDNSLTNYIDVGDSPMGRNMENLRRFKLESKLNYEPLEFP